MSKTLIGTLVGALILFIWQFLSWALFNLHGPQNSYTPNENKIIPVLAENLEDGEYFLPGMPLGISHEQHAKNMEANIGKPWVRIQYKSQMNVSQGMNMFRGFIVNFLSVFLVIWVLLKFAELNFKDCILTCLFFGLVSYMTTTYLGAIWYQVNTIPDLMDAIVQWIICGAWLGYWLNRD